MRRLIGYAFIAAVWLVLFALLGFFGLSYAIYRDLKSPRESRLLEDTIFNDIAVDVFRYRFCPQWADNPACVQFDPLVIYAPKPGVGKVRGVEFDMTITMTADGLRQQPGLARGVDGPPVVLAGDSFTMGMGVQDTETYSAILEQRYGHPTINSGVSSYGTARELLRLQRMGLLARAKVLVIQYCPNDASENHVFLHSPNLHLNEAETKAQWNRLESGRRKRLEPDVTYRRVMEGLFAVLKVQLRIHSPRQFVAALALRRLHDIDRYGAAYPERAAEFLAVLDRFPEIAGKPIIVTELKDFDEGSSFVSELKEKARGRANLYIVPMVLGYGDFYRFDGHLNPRGHERVAEQLDRAIRAVEKRAAK